MKDIFRKIKDGVLTTVFYVSLTVVAFVGYGIQFATFQRAAQAEMESKQKAEESQETFEESQETEDFFETAL